MSFMSKYKLIIFGIVLVAVVLRFYKLDTLPPSLEWDEVATGYDAYSILKTGKDQFGNFLPLTFRSLDDYKPPLYTYLTSASIFIWGWNDWAVRFPAALLGTLAILTTYGMAMEIFHNRKIAFLTSLLLAISPWHVNFSRLALETNSTVFFTTFGIWAFFKGLKNGIWLPLSALLFCLNLYLYHNARVFIPLFGLVLIIINFRKLWLQKTYLVISGVIIIIFCLRLIPIITSVEGQMRFAGTSIFSTAMPYEIDQAKQTYAFWRIDDSNQGVGIYGKVFHNQYVLFGLRLFRNYLSHFNPNFYIFTDDYPRHHVPELGIVYIIELPLIILGLYLLLKNYNNKIRWLILLWILLAPMASSVTRDVPHALRIEIILPTLQILTALGFYYLWSKFAKKKYVKVIIIILYLFNISFFLHQFYYHYSNETSKYWLYGRKEAAQFAESVKQNYDRVIVSTKLEQPHVFFLYYLKYDPAKYLQEGGTVSGGWAEDKNHFDKYYFKPLNQDPANDGRSLFIGLPEEFSSNDRILKTVYYLDGTPAIKIAVK